MRCEDYPCCGHEAGCCPPRDENGQQTGMVCTCGKVLPLNNRYSICDGCMQDAEDDYTDYDDHYPYDDDEYPPDDDFDDDQPYPLPGEELYDGYEDYGDYWGD